MNIEPQFLEDNSLHDSNLDKLGHKSISKALLKIINICPLPFTIGLFGNWGTGKSTITNFILNEVRSLNRKGTDTSIAIAEFDVWKYEKDSLRRQFLLSLKTQLEQQGVLKGYSFDERLLAKVSINFEHKWRLNKSKIKQFLFIFIPSLSFAFGLSYFLYYYMPPLLPLFLSFISSIVTIFGFTSLSKGIAQVITTESKTISYDKFSKPEEFEEIFEKIIGLTKADKILIVFDNLDRVTDTKAVELLSTIKTFLEPKSKKCIFLIQCDEEAIKKHLCKIYKYEKNERQRNSDEFLRKFFNTFIKIPPFISTDLEKYTSEELLKTGVEALYNDADLVTVVVKAFRENPRQIKQFINIFLAHYILVKQRESGKKPYISRDYISSKPAPLAKLLIIRQKWPNEFIKIVDNPKAIKSRLGGDIDKFMEATSTVMIDDVRTLIYLKKSSNELALKGFGDNLKVALEDADIEGSNKIFNEAINNKIRHDKIDNFIVELIDLNDSNKQNLINIINVSGKFGLVTTEKLAEKVSEIIDKRLDGLIGLLDVDSVFNLICNSRENFNHTKVVIDKYIDFISQGQDHTFVEKVPNYQTIVEAFTKRVIIEKTLFTNYTTDITTALEKGHFNNTKTLKLFTSSPNSIKKFVSSRILSRYIDSITIPSPDKPDMFADILLPDKINLALKLDCTKSNKEIGTSFIQKIDSLMIAYLSSPQTDREKQILMFADYISIILDRHTHAIDKQVFDNLSDTLQSVFNTFTENSERSTIITLIIKIINLVSEDRKTTLQQMLDNFFKNIDVDELNHQIKNNGIKPVYDYVKETLEERAVKDVSIFEVLWSHSNSKNNTMLLNKMIDSKNYDTVFAKLETINYRITNKSILVQKLFEHLPSIEVVNRLRFYKCLNRLKCGNDKSIKNQYIEQLQSISVGQPRHYQEIAFNAYYDSLLFKIFSVPTRIQFTSSIAEWLNSLGSITLEQEFAMRTVLLDWNELSITHKDNLLNCIFDKMIAKTETIEDINLGFDLIYEIKPPLKYTQNNKQHFDVTKLRLDSVQNQEIILSITNGFQKIAPNKLTNHSKNFWKSIKNLVIS
jgi:hypothetical protein